MSEDSQSLRASFTSAEGKRRELDKSYDTNHAAYQDTLQAAISLYDRCLQLADSVALFSPNESLDDIPSNDLQFLPLHYLLADLTLRLTAGNRKTLLQQAQSLLASFLRLLDSYEILSVGDARLFEQYRESPNAFSTASTSDPSARRETKIKRLKEEKQLKQSLEYLRRNPSATQDDEIYRRLQLAQVAYCTHQSFQTLESIAQELHILSLAPTEPTRQIDRPGTDSRDRERARDGYSDRLDGPLSQLSAGMKGPLLDSKGKPMRPFTLLDKRQQLRDGVFRPDHSLPTMTIDEYLDEERRRGGMIDGGGPQSAMQPEPDEDNIDKADAETMKARAWDEYTEANPKGSGNTLNRG